MSVTDTRLITIVQADEIIGLSRSTVYELLASRELPSVRIGRARRITSTISSASSTVTASRDAELRLIRGLRPSATRFADEDDHQQHRSSNAHAS